VGERERERERERESKREWDKVISREREREKQIFEMSCFVHFDRKKYPPPQGFSLLIHFGWKRREELAERLG